MIRRWFIWLSFVLLLEPSVLDAATYYVKKTGSNSNNCTAAQNPSTPKLTIGSTNGSGGAGCLEQAGDILIIGDGTYTEGEIQINKSHMTNGSGGTSGNPIIIRSENPLGAIISSTSSCNPNISSYANYITFDGLDMRINASNVYCTPNSAAGTAIRCWNGNTGCVTRNLKIDDPVDGQGRTIRSHGVKSNQPNTIIEYNEIASGIETLAANNSVVRYNYFPCDAVSNHGGGNWGHMMVNKGGSTGVLIYGNYINATCINNWGILLGGSTDQSVPHTYECIGCIARNNIVKVSTSGEALGFQGCDDCSFYRNTTFNGDFSMNAGPAAGNRNNRWKNNLVDCGGSNATSNLSGTYEIDYNGFRNCTGVPSQTHAGTTSNPLFVNSGANDFGLQATSPAIDNGGDDGLPFNGSAPDLGAHETFGCGSGEVGLVDATSLMLTCTNNVAPPLLPASSLTGFTVTADGNPVTVNSAARVGDNIIDLTLGSSITAGQAVLVSYSTGTGNVTNSALIGNTYNQRLNAMTDLEITNNVEGAPPSFTLTQTHFRCHKIEGTEAAPTAMASTDTNCRVIPGAVMRLRLKVACTGADCGARAFIPYYAKNGGGAAAIPSAFDAGNIKFYDTGLYPTPPNGTATTEQLASNHATNVACAIVLTANAVPNLTLPENSEAECEYALQFDSDVNAGDSYVIQLREQNGTELGVYSQSPTITIMPMQASGGF